jgi:hypothetical protein
MTGGWCFCANCTTAANVRKERKDRARSPVKGDAYFAVTPVAIVNGTSNVPIRPEMRSITASLSWYGPDFSSIP